MDKTIQILLIIGLLTISFALSFFFSAAEIVYTSVSERQLELNGHKRSLKALAIAQKFSTISTSLLFGNGLVNIFSASLATLLSQLLLKDVLGDGLASIISAVTVFFIVIVIGEIIPKTLGRKYAFSWSLTLVPYVVFFRVLFFPIVSIVNVFISSFSWLWTNKKTPEVVTDEELALMVDKIEEKGLFDKEHGNLIRSAIGFSETQAYEVMTPRVDIFGFNVEDDVSVLLDHPETFSFSRIPIYDHTMDKIVGILPTPLLYESFINGKPIDIRKLCQTALFIPRTQSISALLKTMNQTGQSTAIVIDEHGGTEGLITYEDIVEELLGEIYDESDVVQEWIIKKADHVFLVDGNMNVEDFFKEMNMKVKITADYTTVSGWCLKQLGHFAKVGDVFTYRKWKVTIIDVSQFTVEKLQLELKETPPKV
jgi:CBS domain containing-hemolysin-like protein